MKIIPKIILIAIIVFSSCNNESNKLKSIDYHIDNYYNINTINFSAGTKSLTINYDTLNWKISKNNLLHQFLIIYFNKEEYIKDIYLSNNNLEQLIVIANNKEYRLDKKIIKINTKVKELKIIINTIKNTQILHNYYENSENYFVEKQNSNNNQIKIVFSNKTKNIIFKYPKIAFQEKRPSLNNSLSNKLLVNHLISKKIDTVIQSIIFNNRNEFSFFRNKISKNNPQKYIAKGTYSKLNNEKLQVKINLYNILNSNKIKYIDTFYIHENKITGGRLFNKIYFDVEEKALVNLSKFNTDFVFEIRYATADNFLDSILYDCPICLLRYEVAQDLVLLNEDLKTLGYKLKIYDCYRPLSVQKAMWKKLPVPGLVANPQFGSRHNRGTAVDVSICNKFGEEINMGTKHDFFGAEARTFFQYLPDSILENRIFLRKMLEKHNFTGINSEWWHFNHISGRKYKVSNINLCN